MDRKKKISTSLKLLIIFAFIFVGFTLYFNNGDRQSEENLLFKIKEAEMILEKNPSQVEMHSTLGWLYYQGAISGIGKRYLKDAEKQYFKAISYNPENVGNYFSLGLVYEELGKVNEAKKQFEKVIKLDPAYAIAYYHLAHLSEISEAIMYLETLLAYEPTAGNVYFELGQLYEQQGNIENSIKMYEFALRFIPNLEEAKVRIMEISNR